MVVAKYFTLRRSELLDVLFISFIFSLLFSLFYLRTPVIETIVFSNLILFLFFFIFLVLFLRMVFMKVISYNQGFEIILYQTTFNRYGLRPYDRIATVQREVTQTLYEDPTYHMKSKKKRDSAFGYRSSQFGGIPMSIMSVIAFIFSLGFIIFPSVWRYKMDKIPHKFIGRQSWYEADGMGLQLQGISGLRFARVLFAGYMFYFIVALVLKFLLGTSSELFYWLFFLIFWIAFVSLLPIPGTEGFDLWHCSRMLWLFSAMMMIFGMLAVLVFTSLTYIVLLSILVIIMTFIVYMWKELM